MQYSQLTLEVQVACVAIVPGENPCENSTCSHICLLSSSDQRGYVCVCPEGYRLAPDYFNCRGMVYSTLLDLVYHHVCLFSVVNDSDMMPPAQGRYDHCVKKSIVLVDLYRIMF